MKTIIYSMLAISLLFASCKKDTPNTNPQKNEKIQIGEMTISQNKNLILWADDSLTAGYTPLYFSLHNAAGEAIADAAISLVPIMDMGSLKHSAPAEQPVYEATSKLYKGAVVFTMPSGSHRWFLETFVDGEKHSFAVSVASEKTKTTGTYVGTNNESYVVSLVKPQKFVAGLNDFEISIFKKENLLFFSPVNGLTVEFMPEMPSMGHGSPNNVNPVSVGNGRYKGKANFTMTGDWRLHFKVKEGGQTIIEDATIDILF